MLTFAVIFIEKKQTQHIFNVQQSFITLFSFDRVQMIQNT